MATQSELQHDGADRLRRSLSPLVEMTAEEQPEGTMTITVTIPDPFPIHPSALTKVGMKTEVKETRYWGVMSKYWSLDDWRAKMQTFADALLSDARRDPVAFFEDRDYRYDD